MSPLEYEHFTPPEETETPTGPSQADLLMQIEADHYTESQKTEPNVETLSKLAAKHGAVKAAATDEAAREAYNASY